MDWKNRIIRWRLLTDPYPSSTSTRVSKICFYFDQINQHLGTLTTTTTAAATSTATKTQLQGTKIKFIKEQGSVSLHLIFQSKIQKFDEICSTCAPSTQTTTTSTTTRPSWTANNNHEPFCWNDVPRSDYIEDFQHRISSINAVNFVSTLTSLTSSRDDINFDFWCIFVITPSTKLKKLSLSNSSKLLQPWYYYGQWTRRMGSIEKEQRTKKKDFVKTNAKNYYWLFNSLREYRI